MKSVIMSAETFIKTVNDLDSEMIFPFTNTIHVMQATYMKNTQFNQQVDIGAYIVVCARYKTEF